MPQLTAEQLKALSAKTELTKQEVADLKDTFGKVWRLSVGAKPAVLDEAGEEIKPAVAPKYCWVREPTRKALGFASGVMKTNPIRYQEILLNDAWLAGDPLIKTDNGLFLSAVSQMGNIIDVTEAELVEL